MEAQEASDDEEMSVEEVQEASDDEEISEQEDDENEKTGKKAGEKTRQKVSEQVPHWKQRWVVDADWEEMEASSSNAARKTALVLMQPFKKLFPELANEINDVCLELKDVVDIQYVDAEDTGIMNIRQVTRSLLDKAKARLQLESLKTLQQVVCTEAIEHPGKDIIVNAPCGFGKVGCMWWQSCKSISFVSHGVCCWVKTDHVLSGSCCVVRWNHYRGGASEGTD